jgi:uncharacterized protein
MPESRLLILRNETVNHTAMKLFQRQIAILLATLLWATTALAQNYPQFTSLYVNDFADLLDPETELRIETELKAAKRERDLEFTLVTIDSRYDYAGSNDFKEFAFGLFNFWGVGNAERNDGILVLVAKGDREMRIVLGDGYPAVFDKRAKIVIDDYYIPYFKNDQYAEGIEAGVYETLKRMRLEFGPDNRPTFASRANNEAQNIYANARSGGFWAWFLGLFGLGGAGAGALAIRRWLRFRPRSCHTCGCKMRRLAEIEDDQYLNHGQRIEEAIKSKDYDVWYCPHDDSTSIEGYKSWFNSHGACPECNFVTQTSERTIQTAATKSHAGRAKVDYACKNCTHRYSETVIIPQITESSSSSGGGDFGGGSSSGGGAGGSW